MVRGGRNALGSGLEDGGGGKKGLREARQAPAAALTVVHAAVLRACALLPARPSAVSLI